METTACARKNFLMILQVRSAILNILLDKKHFFCKKCLWIRRFWWGNIILYQKEVFCKNYNFCLGRLKQSPTNTFIFSLVRLLRKRSKIIALDFSLWLDGCSAICFVSANFSLDAYFLIAFIRKNVYIFVYIMCVYCIF